MGVRKVTKGLMRAVVLILFCGLAMANPPLKDPIQYEEYYEREVVSGTGYVEKMISVVDKHIALEYYDVMTGDGELEMDTLHVYSQNANNLAKNLNDCDGSAPSNLNFFEDTKLTYEGLVPLQGAKFISSDGFYGGINAQVQEIFSVNRMEKYQIAYFGSTENSDIAHTVGLDTANSFNGTWGTDASMHKIFYKDIKSHEIFSGEFDVKKEIKFHESDGEVFGTQ